MESISHPVIWTETLLEVPRHGHQRILLVRRETILFKDTHRVSFEPVEVGDRTQADEITLEDLYRLPWLHSITARNFVSSNSSSRPNPSSTSSPRLVVHRTITP